MDKKEIEQRKKQLMKELEREKQKKKNAENKLSLYEYKERQTANKSRPKIDLNQKHVEVSVEDFEGKYNYDLRRKEWHKKAGYNAKQLVCSRCKDDDNWETILLEDGRHICYYCWIKKPKNFSSSKSSSAKKSVVKTTKVKSSSSSKKASAPKIPVDQKHVLVPVEDYEGKYNYDLRRKEWHKKAGHNAEQLVCSSCKDDDNWETILLEDGRHICYYCWIKKPKATKKAVASKKTTSTSKVKSSKPVAKSTSEPKPVAASKSSNEINVVSLSVYESYDEKHRFDQWNRYVNVSEKPVNCNVCNSKDHNETILLENGKNVCYYCWISEPTASKKLGTGENVVVAEEGESVGKWFWIISITCGVLLIALIVVLSLGIISGNFSFKF